MLVPSLACSAECSYCFGPHHGPTVSPETLEATLDFVARVAEETGQRKVKVTFHGGEPLQAEHALLRQALEGLRRRFGLGGYQADVQSNLWLLDDEYCQVFREHGVEIGTSLDGPEGITDCQRGKGYFTRTTQGIRLAESYGIKVGCIATFTSESAVRWREVFDFFLEERLNFSIHAAVPPLDGLDRRYSITPLQYGDLLEKMLGYYVEHRRDISVSSLDQMCQGFGCGEGKVCTFRDCLGMFLAVDPRGDIYACQRFCGRPAFRLGRLGRQTGLAELMASPMAQRMMERQERVRTACAGCHHFEYCRGGCIYNAWAGRNSHGVEDPYCDAYRRTFGRIRQRVLDEMVSEENVEAIAVRPFTGRGHPLFRKGPLIELVREGRHPTEIARTAKRIVAAVELARGPEITAVAARLVTMGICHNRESAKASLAGLKQQLEPRLGALNNLYLHVTFRCQLHCTHCYARANAHGNQQQEMPVDAVARLIREAKAAGFRQVVLTGGEPLVHHQRDDLLERLKQLRGLTGPTNLVLRTNLAMPLNSNRKRF